MTHDDGDVPALEIPAKLRDGSLSSLEDMRLFVHALVDFIFVTHRRHRAMAPIPLRDHATGHLQPVAHSGHSSQNVGATRAGCKVLASKHDSRRRRSGPW